MINLTKIKKKLLIKIKKNERFEIKKEAVLKNNYYENDNFKIKFSKIKKKDRDLIYKYLSLTNTKNDKNHFLNWGGGLGILDLLIQKINPKISITIIEKENLIKKIKSNTKLLQKYNNRKISFSSDHGLLESEKFKMVIFFGSLCYMPEVYNFFKLTKSNYIAISRLPMVINSKEDFVAYDNFGNHYEHFLSEEKFKRILSKNFKFLYYNEHWGGLKKNKQKIENYKIKSFDILLERVNKN
jgi:hypothetical protein